MHRSASLHQRGADASSQHLTIERTREGRGGIVPHRPVRADVVGDAGAQQRFGQAEVGAHAFLPTKDARLPATASRPAPHSRRFAGIEYQQRRQSAQRRQMRAREFAIGQHQPAFARPLRVEERVPGVMDDIVSTRLELGADARLRRGLADDLGETRATGLAQDDGDALTLQVRAGQIAGGVRDDEHVEFALLPTP
jgi:hypothetical protein